MAAVRLKIVLVDPDDQEKKVAENDPQKLMHKAIDGEAVTDKQLDESLKKAFASGLFTLTEIIFDKEHRHAMVAYSFFCGGLCGHGNTVILEKTGHGWKLSKWCGGWIS